MTIKTPDGKNSFTADDATKASWITVTSTQGTVPTLSVDSAKVSAWVQSQSEDVAEEPVNGERNVNSSGAVVGISLILFKGHGRSQPIPFGPYLAGAGLAMLFLGGQVMTWMGMGVQPSVIIGP